jgi:hypothetical protein
MSERKRRSKLEMKFEEILIANQAEYDYEITKIPYIVPESKHVYTVDWTCLNGLLIETKGYLSDHQERTKYVLLKQQYPDLDLRFVFDNVNKLCGGTKYTHGTWAAKHGFPFCSIKDIDIIKEWLNESNSNK